MVVSLLLRGNSLSFVFYKDHTIVRCIATVLIPLILPLADHISKYIIKLIPYVLRIIDYKINLKGYDSFRKTIKLL